MSATEETKTIPIVSKDKLLEAGVYFGHKSRNWNPKMAPYIHSKKKNIHIIDISKTIKTLEFAFSLISKMTEKGASFIFVGTKKHAQDTIKENALRTNSFYVNSRWLGGLLTNHSTIKKRVRKMFELENMKNDDFQGYTKKEGVLFNKKLEKLKRNLYGIKDMRRCPNVMIVANPQHDLIAIKEARKMGVKVFGIVDTNVDPTLVDVVIPANDDSKKSLALIITILADAIAKAKNGSMLFAYQPDEKIVLPEVERSSNNQYRNSRFSNNAGNRRWNNKKDFNYKTKNTKDDNNDEKHSDKSVKIEKKAINNNNEDIK